MISGKRFSIFFVWKPGKIFLLSCLLLCFITSPLFSQEDSIEYATPDTVNVAEDYYNEYDQIVENPKDDTLKITPRQIDESRIDDFRKDKDFDYSQTPTVGESLWQRFWAWVAEFINNLLRGSINTNWGRVFLWTALLIAVIFIALALLKVDAFKVFFKGADAPTVKGVFHENIHEMDFETLIHEAARKEDWRNAVRLIFLYSLKLLSDGQYIDWQPGKTNHDYLGEIKAQELKPGLSELSFYFDYAWYGGFSISSSQFQTVNSIFKTWRASIR